MAMRSYRVEATCNVPYPRTDEFIVEASKYPVALKRAADEHRKRYSGKFLQEVKFLVQDLGSADQFSGTATNDQDDEEA